MKAVDDTWQRGRWSLAGLGVVLIILAWWTASRIFGHPPLSVVFALVAASYVLAWCIYFLVGRPPFRTQLVNCTLSTVAALVMVGLLELPAGLGLVDYRLLISPSTRTWSTLIKGLDDERRNIFDPELGYRRHPGLHIDGETVGDLTVLLGIPPSRRYRIDARYDKHGFRNDHEIDGAAIVALGDSYLEAGLVEQAALLPARLSQALEVEVANLGLSGYGPQQELVVLRRYGLPLNPQLVIWFFFDGNDLRDVRSYERFVRDRGAVLAKHRELRDRLFTKNVLMALANFTGAHEPHRATARGSSCRFARSEKGEDTVLFFGAGAAALSREDLVSLEVAERIVLEARDLITGHGGRILFVFIPTKFRVYRDLCEFSAGTEDRGVVNDLPFRLQSWSAAQGIPFVDLTGPLQDAAARGSLVYLPDDGHWNAAGHAVAAQTVADFIREHSLLGHPGATNGVR